MTLSYLSDSESAMILALVAAGAAGERQEVPVGAVLRDGAGRFLAECGNNRIAAMDPTGHAEIHALRQGATRVGRDRLGGASLTVTLEPCPMCLAALAMARVARITYEAKNPLLCLDTERVALLHQPASEKDFFVDFNNTNQMFDSFSDARKMELTADAGMLLRIFFDKRRQI